VRTNLMLSVVAVALIGEAAQAQRLNPLVELMSQKKPAFGIYAPANPRAGRGGRGGAAPTTPPADWDYILAHSEARLIFGARELLERLVTRPAVVCAFEDERAPGNVGPLPAPAVKGTSKCPPGFSRSGRCARRG